MASVGLLTWSWYALQAWGTEVEIISVLPLLLKRMNLTPDWGSPGEENTWTYSLQKRRFAAVTKCCDAVPSHPFFPQFLSPYLFNRTHIVTETLHVDTIRVRPECPLQRGKSNLYFYFYYKYAGYEMVSMLIMPWLSKEQSSQGLLINAPITSD